MAISSIRPSSTVPICIDVGTDNKKFLEDPFYIGLRQPRISEAEMNEFMEEFMREMSVVFPELLIQFEDFSTDKVSVYHFPIVLRPDTGFRPSLSSRASATAILSSTTTSKAQAQSCSPVS